MHQHNPFDHEPEPEAKFTRSGLDWVAAGLVSQLDSLYFTYLWRWHR